MAQINLGRVGYVHKGAYAAATTYQKYDVVLYNHGSYLYIGDTASQGHAPTDTAYWQAMLDPSAMQEATEAAVNAADAAHASAMELADQVDRLTTPFSITGDMATCRPVSDYPLGVISHIAPVQAGSGDPGPSNVRPISGWTGANLTRTGENLLDYDAWKGAEGVIRGTAVWANYGVAITAGAEGDAYTEPANIKIPCKPGIKYVLSWAHSGAEGGVYIFPNGSTERMIFTLSGVGHLEYTAQENDNFFTFRVGVTAANATATYSNVRINLESDKGFSPYKGQMYTAPFGQTVYGGTLDWKTGVLKSDGVMVEAGSFDWVYMYDHMFYTSTPNYDDVKKILCEIYPERGSGENGLFLLPDAPTVIYLRDTTLTDGTAGAEELKQKLTGHKIYCQRAIAEVIQLTPQQILSLAGENNLWSDCGETTVNGPNSPKVMENRIAALEAAIANMA